jgi:hypothetical protein
VSWAIYSDELVDENDDPLPIIKLRCRIDVLAGSIEDAIVTDNYSLGLHLPNTAVTTNIYSTDYPQFPILIDLESNQIDTQGLFIDRDEEGNELADNGAIIDAAWFTDPDAKEAFALRVVDDRTLEVVPNIDFTGDYADAVKAVKGKYTSAVTVKFKDVDQTVDTDNKLTLTVKKTLPKVTATAVKLNSFIPGDGQILSTNPANSLSIRPNPEKTQPNWIYTSQIFDTGGHQLLAVSYDGAYSASASGNLYLLVQPTGWAVEVPVTVSVKASKTAPKLKATGTATINPQYIDEEGWGSNYFGWATIQVTPAQLASRLTPKVTKITEGKSVWSVEKGNLGAAPISVYAGLSGTAYYFSAQISDITTFDSSKARTFKVTVSVGGDENGKGAVTTNVTVKTVADGTKPAAKLKVSGTIDTQITGSFATVKWTESNTAGLMVNFRIDQYDGSERVGDVTELFSWSRRAAYELRVCERQRGTVPSNYTYYIVPEFYMTNEASEAELVWEGTKVKLPIKWSASRPAITATLKAAGTIDPIRPESAVTLTASLKKAFFDVMPGDLEISPDKSFTEAFPLPETAFRVYNAGGGKITMVLLDEARDVVMPGKLFARINIPATDSRTDGKAVTSAPVQIKITKGSAKITADVKTVQLLKNDRYSYAKINLLLPSGLSGIKSAVLDAKSDERFDLVDNGGGSLELHLDQSNPLTTKGTAKILVTLEGNNTGKPDATISVSVKFA